MTDSSDSLGVPDVDDQGAFESSSTAELVKSVRRIKTWLVVLTVAMALVFIGLVGLTAAVGLASFGVWPGFHPVPFGAEGEFDAVPEGPPLSSVASLPVDASGEGTIQGTPTGEASTYDDSGTFVLVLDPAPAGLPERTTVHVAFDRTTKVYRNGQPLGDPLTSMMEESGPMEADPTAAGTVVVQFRVKGGRPFAERLDLSDEYGL